MGNRLAGSGGSTAFDGGGGGVFLPPDVLYEILLRVPVARLCRFRAVCRSWRALLSDPQFVAAHGARHPRGHQLFAVAVRGFFPKDEAHVELLDVSSGRVVRWVPSCVAPSSAVLALQGLVCTVGSSDQRLRVVDPLAGAVSILPVPGPGSAFSRFFVLGRAAGSTGHYKLLSITRTRTLGVHLSHLLTLEANGGGGAGVWREAPSPPAAVRTGYPWEAAVAGGVVYVLERGRRQASDWIAAFYLEKEQWRPGLLRGPLPPDPLDAVISLGELDGRLAAVTGSLCRTLTSALSLWLLEAGTTASAADAGGGPWQRKCTVQASSMPWGSGECAMGPVWVLDGSAVAFMVRSPPVDKRIWRDDVRGRSNWVLQVYDPKTKGCHDVVRSGDGPRVAIGLYSGNLLSFGSATNRP